MNGSSHHQVALQQADRTISNFVDALNSLKTNTKATITLAAEESEEGRLALTLLSYRRKGKCWQLVVDRDGGRELLLESSPELRREAVHRLPDLLEEINETQAEMVAGLQSELRQTERLTSILLGVIE